MRLHERFHVVQGDGVEAGARALVLTADTPVVGTKRSGERTVWDLVEPGWMRANFDDPAPSSAGVPWAADKAMDLGPQDVAWLAARGRLTAGDAAMGITLLQTAVNQASMGVALFGVSVPSFWLGLNLILLFSVYLGLFPVAGYVPLHQSLGGAARSVSALALAKLGSARSMATSSARTDSESSATNTRMRERVISTSSRTGQHRRDLG